MCGEEQCVWGGAVCVGKSVGEGRSSVCGEQCREEQCAWGAVRGEQCVGSSAWVLCVTPVPLRRVLSAIVIITTLKSSV